MDIHHCPECDERTMDSTMVCLTCGFPYAPDWISVEDERKPGHLDCVLILNSLGGVCVDQYAYFGEDLPQCNGFTESEVTHWQPLPNPPACNEEVTDE